MDIKVADEVWVGCALLHKELPHRASFSDKEIIDRVKQENVFGEVRIGITWHVGLHCVANVPSNKARYRMLYKLSDGTKRLFRESDDYHFSREGGKTIPEGSELPEEYRYLLKWYTENYNTGVPPQPIRTIDPPKGFEVESVELGNEKQVADFSYNCPSNSKGLCKECSLFLSEDEVKKVLIAKLTKDNWNINKTAMGKAHGVDIVAMKQPDGTLLIEAKSEGSLVPMRINYFIAVLGELLQKMDASNKQYAVALPAYQQYASLINRLPFWVKQQLKLNFFLVKKQSEGRYAVGHIAY